MAVQKSLTKQDGGVVATIAHSFLAAFAIWFCFFYSPDTENR